MSVVELITEADPVGAPISEYLLRLEVETAQSSDCCGRAVFFLGSESLARRCLIGGTAAQTSCRSRSNNHLDVWLYEKRLRFKWLGAEINFWTLSERSPERLNFPLRKACM